MSEHDTAKYLETVVFVEAWRTRRCGGPGWYVRRTCECHKGLEALDADGRRYARPL